MFGSEKAAKEKASIQRLSAAKNEVSVLLEPVVAGGLTGLVLVGLSPGPSPVVPPPPPPWPISTKEKS